jgi:hypothetical protein
MPEEVCPVCGKGPCLHVMDESELLAAALEARRAFQEAMGWWAACSDVRPAVVMRFFAFLEEKYLWMQEDLSGEERND